MNRPRDRPRPTFGLEADRGVSEVIAFVLVFAIILGGVGMLSVTAFQAMEEYQGAERIQNAERAMDALAENFNDVLRYDAVDQRYGELALREGTVSTGSDGTELTVTGLDDPVDPVELGEFSYSQGSDTIAYEGGGIVRSSDGGSAMLSRPTLRCDDDAAVIALVSIQSDDRSLQSASASGFTISVDERETTVQEVSDDVAVSVDDTDYDRAWESTFEGGGWEWDDDAGTGTCSGIDRAVVTVVTADVEF